MNNIRHQVAVNHGVEEISEPKMMIHMIYIFFLNYIGTVLFFDDSSLSRAQQAGAGEASDAVQYDV